MAFPFSNQIDLLTAGPRVEFEDRHWDKEGYERTERRTGAVQCPKCNLWWPSIEQPDWWEENPISENHYDAEGWWGGVVCSECQLLMIEQPDGTPEVYDLTR